MNQFKFIEIDQHNLDILQYFIQTAGVALSSFRYYQDRPFTIVNSHFITLIILNEVNEPVCYGHLKKEETTAWLGIAVIENNLGQGLGNLMMTELVQTASRFHINEIHLVVDETNSSAVGLYEKFNFTCYKRLDNRLFYKLSLETKG